MSDEASAPTWRDRPAVSAADGEGPGIARAAWHRWKKIAHAVGVVQTRLILIAFYFLVAFPLGLAMRLSGDRLNLKLESRSHWSSHPHEEQSLETARRQF